MRNVLLAGVLVVVLVAGGVGGAFAGFSDSETSLENYISTGSLDLKVEDQDDAPWGDGVPGLVQFVDVMPEKLYVAEVEVANDGQSKDPLGEPVNAYLYIHFKAMECSNVVPEHPGIEGETKPEPELVAEYGGKVNCTEVPGWGVIGDNCSMKHSVWVEIFFDDDSKWGPQVLNNLILQQIYLGQLPPCGEVHHVKLVFWLDQILDPDWELRGLPEKFKYWPTNALMCDRVDFNVEFDLLQHPEAD